jgi:hypothetical protein
MPGMTAGRSFTTVAHRRLDVVCGIVVTAILEYFSKYRSSKILDLGRFLRQPAALLGCILRGISLDFLPQAIGSACYLNFLGARGHY